MKSASDPLNTPEPDPHPDAEQRLPDDGRSDDIAEIKALRIEVNELHGAMESHPSIDQARGMLMSLGPCTAEEAWKILVEVSQHSNTKLRVVAEELVATTEGEPLVSPVREAFNEALRRRGTGTG